MQTSHSASRSMGTHIAHALAVIEAHSASLNEKTRSMQETATESERQRAANAEERKRVDARMERVIKRRVGRAIQGTLALAAIGRHPDIQKMLGAKALLMAQSLTRTSVDDYDKRFILYQAVSEYDPQARDLVEITFHSDRLVVEYGVVMAYDVREVVIHYTATAEQIETLLEKIAGPPMGYAPLSCLESGRWSTRDPDEGGSLAFQLFVDCATASHLEAYLAHALAHIERESIAG